MNEKNITGAYACDGGESETTPTSEIEDKEHCGSCGKKLKRSCHTYMAECSPGGVNVYKCDECACYESNYCEYLSEEKIKEIRSRDGSAQSQYITLTKKWWQFWK